MLGVGVPNSLKRTALILLVVLPIIAHAEKISYEIYSVPLFFGEREVITKGILNYTLDDVLTDKGPVGDNENRTVTLPLSHGFSIGTTVYSEPALEGFGLWMRKDGGGFSWEWFYLENGNVYKKLQGPGRVKVRLTRKNNNVQLAAIEFLETLTLRLDTMNYIPFWFKDTHNLVVKKGSAFVLAP